MKRPDPNQQSLFGPPPARVADELPGQTFLPLADAPKLPPVSMPSAPVVLARLDVLKAARSYLDEALGRRISRHVEAITCAECNGTLYVCQCGGNEQCGHDCAHDVDQCSKGMCAFSRC